MSAPSRAKTTLATLDDALSRVQALDAMVTRDRVRSDAGAAIYS